VILIDVIFKSDRRGFITLNHTLSLQLVCMLSTLQVCYNDATLLFVSETLYASGCRSKHVSTG